MQIKQKLVFAILKTLENRSINEENRPLPHFSDFDPPEVSYHVRYLYEGGIIEAALEESEKSQKWAPGHLTYKGHEYLDKLKGN